MLSFARNGRRVIDIHNHILPGVDDGAKSMAEALEMARIAERDGIQVIVTTPHHFPAEGGPFVQQARTRVTELQANARAQGLSLVFETGQENMAGPDVPQHLQEGGAVPLAGTRYLLVEPPFTSYPPYVEEMVFQLQLRGYAPILAHPERCASIQADQEIVQRLVERGILMQVNTGSLLGHYGVESEKAARALLERNLVHVLATDAHNPEGVRVPVISEGVKAAAGIVGEERAWEMVTTAPEAVLRGRAVPVLEPSPRSVGRRGRLFGLF
ncbi:MAG: hypothetical protein HY685_01505 [Chloroflexi bacterium]|nr:hypothetical protein [Chloroflexota bacterium]